MPEPPLLTEPKLPPERWTITFEAEPGPVPVVIRIRQLLKYAVRRQGLRSVSYSDRLPPGATVVILAPEEPE